MRWWLPRASEADIEVCICECILNGNLIRGRMGHHPDFGPYPLSDPHVRSMTSSTCQPLGLYVAAVSHPGDLHMD
jgi:hypothetical protein